MGATINYPFSKLYRMCSEFLLSNSRNISFYLVESLAVQYTVMLYHISFSARMLHRIDCISCALNEWHFCHDLQMEFLAAIISVTIYIICS